MFSHVTISNCTTSSDHLTQELTFFCSCVCSYTGFIYFAHLTTTNVAVVYFTVVVHPICDVTSDKTFNRLFDFRTVNTRNYWYICSEKVERVIVR